MFSCSCSAVYSIWFRFELLHPKLSLAYPQLELIKGSNFLLVWKVLKDGVYAPGHPQINQEWFYPRKIQTDPEYVDTFISVFVIKVYCVMHLSGVSTVAVGAFGFIFSPRIRYDKWFSTKFCSNQNAGLMEHAFKCAGAYKCYYRCDELRITVALHDSKRKQAQGLAKFMWRTARTRRLTWKGTAGGCRAAERLGETDESWVFIC
jgi:hypothetical protein